VPKSDVLPCAALPTLPFTDHQGETDIRMAKLQQTIPGGAELTHGHA
jgi:hypothetical protein